MKFVFLTGFVFILALAGRQCLIEANEGQGKFGIASRRNLAQESRNKELVTKFYIQVFGQRNVSAIPEFVAPNMIQHNPDIPDGMQGMLNQVLGFFPPGTPPSTRLSIKRVAAEGDFVWLHVLNNISPDSDPSADVALVGIYRVHGGLIVEHFSVLQPFPTTSANPHPMFQSTETEYKKECTFVKI